MNWHSRKPLCRHNGASTPAASSSRPPLDHKGSSDGPSAKLQLPELCSFCSWLSPLTWVLNRRPLWRHLMDTPSPQLCLQGNPGNTTVCFPTSVKQEGTLRGGCNEKTKQSTDFGGEGELYQDIYQKIFTAFILFVIANNLETTRKIMSKSTSNYAHRQEKCTLIQ